MAASLVKIEIGGVTYVIGENDTVKYLSNDAAQGTGPLSFREAGTFYQVPSDKTFTILGFAHVGHTLAGEIVTMFEGDASNSNTGQVDKAKLVSLSTGDYLEYPTPNMPTIAANHFITADATAANAGFWFCIGIEE